MLALAVIVLLAFQPGKGGIGDFDQLLTAGSAALESIHQAPLAHLGYPDGVRIGVPRPVAVEQLEYDDHLYLGTVKTGAKRPLAVAQGGPLDRERAFLASTGAELKGSQDVLDENQAAIHALMSAAAGRPGSSSSSASGNPQGSQNDGL